MIIQPNIIRPYDKPSFEYTQRLGFNRADPLARGLVGGWILNEGSGSQILDLSSSRFDGILGGGTKWEVTNKDVGLYFNGSNSYCEVGTANDLNIVDVGRSIVALIKSPSAATNTNIVAKASNHATPINFVFGTSTTNKLRVYVRHQEGSNDPNPTVSSSAVIKDNSFHCVGMTYNPVNGYTELYIDGGLDKGVTLTSGNIISSDRKTQVGAGYFTIRYGYFLGHIIYVYIFDRILSAYEFAWFNNNPYAMFRPLLPLEIIGAAAKNLLLLKGNLRGNLQELSGGLM